MTTITTTISQRVQTTLETIPYIIRVRSAKESVKTLIEEIAASNTIPEQVPSDSVETLVHALIEVMAESTLFPDQLLSVINAWETNFISRIERGTIVQADMLCLLLNRVIYPMIENSEEHCEVLGQFSDVIKVILKKILPFGTDIDGYIKKCIKMERQKQTSDLEVYMVDNSLEEDKSSVTLANQIHQTIVDTNKSVRNELLINNTNRLETVNAIYAKQDAQTIRMEEIFKKSAFHALQAKGVANKNQKRRDELKQLLENGQEKLRSSK